MSSSSEDGWVLKFVPFASTVESSFWVRYCQEKLDTIKLSEDAVSISASYGIESPPRLQLQESSLQKEELKKNEVIHMSGSIMGYNTVESFQSVDKNQLLRDWFTPLVQKGDSALLNSFLLLTYADLKNHKVLYWFAIPALIPAGSIRATNQEWLSEAWTEQELQDFLVKVDSMRFCEQTCPPFFIATRNECLPLNQESWQRLSNDENVCVGFFDPASYSKDQHVKSLPMGWPMRNLVAYMSLHLDLGGQSVRILSYRPQHLRRIYPDTPRDPPALDTDKSLLVTVVVPPKENYLYDTQYKVVGWELNARSKPGPRWVNLRPLLDEKHLAVQAADLNLKLMKWRMIPSLDIQMLQSLKVLIIGAGTLGCSVSRVLLGWGVRNITFVDNGKVSYSNPVRQNLFSLADCKDEETGAGRPKAVAAADALHSIAADVDSHGVVLSIPMPGHVESDRDATQESVLQMDEMVHNCDVVFLLTDTRESRWLPTVMAAAHNKPLVNAALGLDSWLVMRHGGGIDIEQRLGCYFCNDVVAPENSMKNRTLDQQCTVTRPGLAPLASSMAAEMLVALLHHPLQQSAAPPASAVGDYAPTVSDSTSPLGVIPHQIRGSLVSYTMMTPTVPAFGCCTACSAPIVEAYQEDKVELVQQACQSRDGTFLEDLSGLTAFRAEATSKMVDMEDWEDDE